MSQETCENISCRNDEQLYSKMSTFKRRLDSVAQLYFYEVIYGNQILFYTFCLLR